MHGDLNLQETQKEWHGTWKSYGIGFISSLILTFLSFFLAAKKLLSEPLIIYVLVFLALLQAIVQLFFFLHLGQEAKPRWESLIFYFMLLVLAIIALGSLWIMNDLNQRVMFNMGLILYPFKFNGYT